MDNYRLLLVIFMWNNIQISTSILHEKTLMWSESTDYSRNAHIFAFGGDPEDWMEEDQPSKTGQVIVTDPEASRKSNRIALAFRYSTMSLYWSDIGFREIVKSKLQRHDTTPYLYNATLNRIYIGTSSEVNGLAVDWLSGSIYWTDANYDWISVASVDKEDVFNHLITEDLEKPMGLVVHPKKGKLIWADLGPTKRIEMANLDGTGRKALVLTTQGEPLTKPMGLTIDYQTDDLYWVDHSRGSINRYNLNSGDQSEFSIMTSAGGHPELYGIALYQDYIFVTDQLNLELRAFNRTTNEQIRSFKLDGVPHAIMMYDESQQESLQSECSVLNCDHICVSMGEGKGRCLCGQGFKLKSDQKSCEKSQRITPPAFLYSIGNKLCTSRISIADRQNGESVSKDIDCFFSNVSHVEAIAFHADASTLYFSDSGSNTIEKLNLETLHKEVIAVNTGKVGGIDVDWLSSNIYWTDQEFGQIIVADLHGRNPKVLLRNLPRPVGIAVNPPAGTMFWSNGEQRSIYTANMDGTNMTRFVADISEPDGMVIDIKDNRLYWVDQGGIRSCDLEGKNWRTLVTASGEIVGDVTVYHDYIAYTDGKGNVNYFHKDNLEGEPLEIPHVESYVSHDIITYSKHMQPIDKPGECDNSGCSQTCLPVPNGMQCTCSYGYILKDDGKTCHSELVSDKFLLAVDPYQRQIYQISLNNPQGGPAAIDTPSGNFPRKVDLNPSDGHVYWLDAAGKVIKRAPLHGEPSQYTGPYVLTVPEPTTIEAFVVSGFTDEIIYSDSSDQQLYRVGFHGNDRQRSIFSDAKMTSALVFDNDASTGNVYWVETYGHSIIYMKSIYEPSNRKNEIWSSKEVLTALCIDMNEQRLYWSTATKLGWVTLNGKKKKEIFHNTTADFASIASTKDYLWLTMTKAHKLYRLHKDQGSKLEVYSNAQFSRITDIKSFENFDGTKFVIAAGITQTEKTMSTSMLGGIIAGVALLLIVLIIIGVLIFKKHSKRKLPPSDFQGQSHENPTYEVTPGSMNIEASEETVVNESPYQTLPEERGRPDSTASRDSYLPDVVNTVGGPEGAASDTEQLVAVSSEITMDIKVGADQVAYTKQ